MDIDLADFERAMRGDVDLPLLFDLLGSGFRTASPLPPVHNFIPENETFALSDVIHESVSERDVAVDAQEPPRDAPLYSTSTSDEESEEVEASGAIEIAEDVLRDSEQESGSDADPTPLSRPAAAGSNLNTPRSEIDKQDYDREDTSLLKWQFCDAWIGSMNFATDGDVRIRVPGANAQIVFDIIRAALEELTIPAADQLCRILLARILFVWDLSMRIAWLRACGHKFPSILEEAEVEFEPDLSWVWTVFGPFDYCDQVDTYVSCKVDGEDRVLTIATPAWIWWYIDLLFEPRPDGVAPRAWTNLDHIAEYKGEIVIDHDDFKYVILANGIATLHKRQLQTRNGANFFVGQHAICSLYALKDIKCLTRQSLGGALSSRASSQKSAVLRREARTRAASRMRRHVGMFKN